MHNNSTTKTRNLLQKMCLGIIKPAIVYFSSEAKYEKGCEVIGHVRRGNQVNKPVRMCFPLN